MRKFSPREGGAGYVTAELADEGDGGRGGYSGGEEIVAEQHALAFLHGVLMDFKLVAAVFKLIGFRDGLPWQFFRLSHGYKTSAQAIGERGRENKSARFDVRDDVDFHAVNFTELVDQRMKSLAVLKQRGQVG